MSWLPNLDVSKRTKLYITATVHSVQAGLAHFLMLAAMTFRYELLLSIMFGLGLEHVLFFGDASEGEEEEDGQGGANSSSNQHWSCYEKKPNYTWRGPVLPYLSI
jgi:hypothetical protein